MSSVLIMAGGTGGHVYPGLAVAERLRATGIEVVWLGTRKGLEARVVPEAGVEIEFISIGGLRRRGAMQWILLPLHLFRAMAQAARIMIRRKPTAVLSMGGFAAGPGGLVAWMLRKPLVIHEQNAIPGLTNRVLALFAESVLTGFPGVLAHLPRTRHVGNPVRADIAGLPMPDKRLASHGERLRVLVLGGSQGARHLNAVLADTIREWPGEQRPEIWHQCGPRWLDETRDRYTDALSNVKLTAYIDDMAGAYDWADVVICRAGAMTVAELAAVGLASVLVPYPYATDDHQTANARFLEQHDAAVVVPEDRLTSERLIEMLQEFQDNREVLSTMAIQARACSMPDADEMIAAACREVMYA